MGQVVNLRRARKRRTRDETRREGDENAARHGRTKGDRAREAAERESEARRHEGHRLDRDEDE
ncbi:MAG: DUF4169 family protein [Pseudomonadota bacterium]